MNYRHIYCKIISYAKSEEKLGLRKKGNGNYYEAHHILPKSLFPLWKNRKSNIVLLTAREHFFVHELLTKIYPTSQMTYALHAFISRPNADYKITPREYERIRTAWAKFFREKMLGKPANRSREVTERINAKNRGSKRTLEQRQRMSEAQKRVAERTGGGNRKGKKGTPECKKHCSEGQFAKYAKSLNMTVEEYKLYRKDLLKKAYDSCKKHWYNNGKENIVAEQCPEGYTPGKLLH